MKVGGGRREEEGGGRRKEEEGGGRRRKEAGGGRRKEGGGLQVGTFALNWGDPPNSTQKCPLARITAANLANFYLLSGDAGSKQNQSIIQA